MKEKYSRYGFATRSIHAGEETDRREGSTGDVVVPIHLSTTYVWDSPDRAHSKFEYVRSGNPTRSAYETKLAALEGGRFALAFASGLAAENALLQAVAGPRCHVVAFDDLYGGTRRLFDDVFPNISASYVDLSEVGNFENAITPETEIVWIESPTNPMIKICDIRRIASIAREKGIMVVVDNTFLSPYFQQPLELGADVVVHSSTKYIGGHSDVLGGALVTSDEALYGKLWSIQNNCGAVLSPFDSYLNIRGLKTLALRMEQHQKNAMEVAQYLAGHPKVEKVLYPGLPDHPGHDTIRSQASGFGGMLSFRIKGTVATAKDFLSRLELFTLAESLGGVESLIELPSQMTHVGLDKDIRQEIGITDTLMRVSIGIENAADLIADLGQALAAAE